MAAIQRSARMTRAAGFLDSLNTTALQSVREQADVRVSTFDQSASVLNAQTTVTNAIQKLLPSVDKD